RCAGGSGSLGERKLAAPARRLRRRSSGPHRAGESAGLPLAFESGGRRRLLAHRLHRPHPARRVRPARARLLPAHDARDRSALLDRAAAKLGTYLPRADAGGAYQDHGHPEALGAAALLWPRHPLGRRWAAALLAAQPCRRHASWRGCRGRVPRRALCPRQGRREDFAPSGDGDRRGTAAMTTPILELRQATKRYAGVPAIENIDFDLRRAEIHALVGENGAGKSTLTKVMAGVVALSSGKMLVEGREAEPRTPLEARQLGIAMVFQENSLVPTMTVAQNLFLGQEKFYNRLRGIYIAAQQFLQSLNFDVAPTTTVSLLGAAKKQMVEIARAVLHNARVIIFDEPTASLTPEEKKYFFDLVLELKRRGVSIIFISHALEEALQISDRITVLRDGRHVVTDDTRTFDRARIVQAMVGRDLSQTLYGRRKQSARPPGQRVLSVQNLRMAALVKNTSLSVFAGQITGVFGLVGAGRTETFKVVSGVMKRDFFHGGEVFLHGKRTRYRVPAPAVRDGIAYVTEDRKVEGFFETMSIARNIYMGLVAKLGRKRAILSQHESQAAGETWI